MLRPTRVLCVVALGLAVLIGCTKKKKDDEVSSNNNNAPVATTPQPTTPGTEAPGGTPTPAGRVSGGGLVTGDGGVVGAPPAPVTSPTTGGAKPPTPAPGGSGGVQLVQGGFDKVEAALTAAKGKVVLVDCWAVWCGPCVQSFPELVKKHEKYKDKGLMCLTVSLDAGQNPPDKVLGFLKDHKAAFPNFYLTQYGREENQKLVQLFDYKGGIPHAVLFNKQGARAWVGHPMRLTAATIEAELAK